MCGNKRSRKKVLVRSWTPLLGILVVLAGPGLAEEDPAKKSEPPLLPAIELPPPPPNPIPTRP